MQDIHWHDISMYEEMSGVISLERLMPECLKRLHVLVTIQNKKISNNNISKDNLRRSVVEELKLVDCKFYVKSLTAPNSDTHLESFESRKLDLAAHLMLTTMLARERSSARWLFLHECDLFNLRLSALRDFEFDEWLEKNRLKYEKVDLLEIIDIQGELLTYLGPRATLQEVYNTKFYKISQECAFHNPIETVCKVGCFRYLTEFAVRYVIVDRFARELKQKIEKVMILKSIEIPGERISMLEKYLKSSFVFEFEKNIICKYPVRENDIVKLVNECFPPCMTRLDDVLKCILQLKHSGRRQYQLFLKDIGLSLEECISYMRKNYIRLDDLTFKRQYGYYIRHDYGVEGGRITYKSFSCRNIISHTDFLKLSGCPFTDKDKQYYGSRYKMCTNHITDIEDLVKAPCNERKACAMLFKNRYGKDIGEEVESPVQYFMKSNFYNQLGKKL